MKKRLLALCLALILALSLMVSPAAAAGPSGRAVSYDFLRSKIIIESGAYKAEDQSYGEIRYTSAVSEEDEILPTPEYTLSWSMAQLSGEYAHPEYIECAMKTADGDFVLLDILNSAAAKYSVLVLRPQESEAQEGPETEPEYDLGYADIDAASYTGTKGAEELLDYEGPEELEPVLAENVPYLLELLRLTITGRHFNHYSSLKDFGFQSFQRTGCLKHNHDARHCAFCGTPRRNAVDALLTAYHEKMEPQIDKETGEVTYTLEHKNEKAAAPDYSTTVALANLTEGHQHEAYLELALRAGEETYILQLPRSGKGPYYSLVESGEQDYAYAKLDPATYTGGDDLTGLEIVAHSDEDNHLFQQLAEKLPVMLSLVRIELLGYPEAFNLCRDFNFQAFDICAVHSLVADSKGVHCQICDAECQHPVFQDVTDGDWFAEPVIWAYDHAVTDGVGGSSFAPDMNCSRAQIVTLLWRAAGSPVEADSQVLFDDVPAEEWYTEAVRWAVAHKITTGTGDNRFSPDAVCTRAQIVTFLWRAAGSPAPKSAQSFLDVPQGSWYEVPVQWAVEAKVTTGVGQDRFDPEAVCSRAQAVTFLYRYFQ